MRFALDARAAFLDPFRGFGRMVRELAPALARQGGPEIFLCVPAWTHIPEEWYSLPSPLLKLRRPPRGAFLVDGPAWAWTVRRWAFQGLHLPAWGVPAGIPVPVVATFHDATPLLYPQGLSWWVRKRVAAALASLRRASFIHAVSRFAAQQLAQFQPQLAGKTVVVPHGVSPRFSPGEGPGEAFVLGVGGGEAHKNWELVLEVYATPQARSLPPLRLVGPVAKEEKVLQSIRQRGLTQRVQLFPQVDESTLVACYRQALALVFPSLNEGFGLPALEAMACGCPVLAAAAGALPEVCGPAALLLPPREVEPWLTALHALHTNPALRAHLREAGLARARSFSWEATARSLLELYREAARKANSWR